MALQISSKNHSSSYSWVPVPLAIIHCGYKSAHATRDGVTLHRDGQFGKSDHDSCNDDHDNHNHVHGFTKLKKPEFSII